MSRFIRLFLVFCLLSALLPAANAAGSPGVTCRFTGSDSAVLALEGLDSRVYGVQMELVLPGTYPQAEFIAQQGDAYALCHTQVSRGETIVSIYLLPDTANPLGAGGKAVLGTLDAGAALELPDQVRLTLLDPSLRPSPGADSVWIDLRESSSSGNTGGSAGDGSGGSSSAERYYRVDVDGAGHGTVQVSPSRARRGETVTITAQPDPGYVLERLSAVDSGGEELELRERGGVFTFSMPRAQVEVRAVFRPQDELPDENHYDTWGSLPYLDVAEQDWFWEAVSYVHYHGLMNGTGPQFFGPGESTTRGMIVTILYRLEGSPAASLSRFRDVAENQYYSSAVAWASASGIVEGYSDGRFGPNDSITREQMAAILYRYAQYKEHSVSARTSLSGFTDAEETSPYAWEAMQWANAEELIGGTGPHTLAPRGSATRSQAAAILMRFCRQIAVLH